MDELDYNSEGFDDGAGSEVAIGTGVLQNTLFILQYYFTDQCNGVLLTLTILDHMSYRRTFLVLPGPENVRRKCPGNNYKTRDFFLPRMECLSFYNVSLCSFTNFRMFSNSVIVHCAASKFFKKLPTT